MLLKVGLQRLLLLFIDAFKQSDDALLDSIHSLSLLLELLVLLKVLFKPLLAVSIFARELFKALRSFLNLLLEL